MDFTHSDHTGGSANPNSNPFSGSHFFPAPSASTSRSQPHHGGSSTQSHSNPAPPQGPFPSLSSPSFEIFDWYPHFLSCHTYFLTHAQHTDAVRALAAFLNIALPYQLHPTPAPSSSSPSPHNSAPGSVSGGVPGTGGGGLQFSQPHQHSHTLPNPLLRRPSLGLGSSGSTMNTPSNLQSTALFVSLTPYIRRLIATGFDTPAVLHGFFGDAWSAGVGPLHEVERRNYLFASKSASWLKVKSVYDIGAGDGGAGGIGGAGGGGGQVCPWLSPLRRATDVELRAAEEGWSEWLAMQDWMVGERGIDVAEGERGGTASPRGGGGAGRGSFRGDHSRGGAGSSGGGFGRMDMDDGVEGMRIKTEPR